MERCKKASVGVWVDEVQTFARTGMLFAFRSFGLDEHVDVVTAGKTLQGSAVLFSKAYNPRPGLVAGTYAGSTVGMAVGTRIIERLEEDISGVRHHSADGIIRRLKPRAGGSVRKGQSEADHLWVEEGK